MSGEPGVPPPAHDDSHVRRVAGVETQPHGAFPSEAALLEVLEEPRGFWEHYSPNGELAWSSAMSLGLFLLLVLLPIVLVTPLVQRDPTPPAVDVLYVGEDQNAPPEEGEDFEAEAAMGTAPEASPEEVPEELVVDEVDAIKEPELPPPDVKPVDQGQELAELAAVARSALDRLTRAKAQLDANLRKGESTGEGGGGGTGTSGRGARVARWVLHFNTRSSKDYLKQLDGVGAQIAFPEVGNKWRYYFDVSSKKRRSEVRDLTSENRVYWVDEKPQSIGGVAQELGIAVPPFMIVFLPVALEDRMLKLELAYQNLSEDEIRRTDFAVVVRAGHYDIRVTRQIPK
jgi:hypothetical protein